MMTSVGALGRGIHAATIELQDGDTYRVKLLSGERCTATAAPDVSPKLLGECLSARRTVMLADSEHGPVILGALQTAPTPYVDPKTGAFDVAAEHIRLRADATISLQVGPTSLALEKSGVARIEGEQVVIDAAALARVLATKLELP
jgi:hypothetical protein